MSIQAVLDENAFSELEEPLQALYRQNSDNGNYYLDLPQEEAGKLAFNLKTEVEKLRQHNERVLGEKKDWQAKFRELEEKLSEAPKKSEPAPDFEKERQKLQESFNETLAAKEKEIEQLRSAQTNAMKESVIAKLRAEYDLNDTADYVLDRFIRVVPDGEGSDRLVARVFENDAPAYVAGQYKTPDILLQEWKQQGKHLGIFNAPKGGTGGRNDYGGGKSGAKVMKRSAFEEMSASEKVAFMRDGGSLTD